MEAVRAERRRAAKRRESQSYRDRHTYYEAGTSRRHRWTEADYVRVMKHETSDDEIARELNVSVRAVQNARRRVRLGDVVVRGLKPDDDALRELSRHRM